MNLSKLTAIPGKLSGPMRMWKAFGTLNVDGIKEQSERSFMLAIVGEPDHNELLESRLSREAQQPIDGPNGPADIRRFVQRFSSLAEVPQGMIVLHSGSVITDEARLAVALAETVENNKDLRLSLARNIPAFRPAVASFLIQEASWQNAKIAIVSSLPSIIPVAGLLAPAAALGDMIILTRNQAILLLTIAAAYGHEVDMKARLAELMPVVGGAFGWRAAARELVGMVPGGVGIAVKGSIAFAGTFAAGKAAAVYYSTGHALSKHKLDRLYSAAYASTSAKIRDLLSRRSVLSAKSVSESVDHKAREQQLAISVDNEITRELERPTHSLRD